MSFSSNPQPSAPTYAIIESENETKNIDYTPLNIKNKELYDMRYAEEIQREEYRNYRNSLNDKEIILIKENDNNSQNCCLLGLMTGLMCTIL